MKPGPIERASLAVLTATLVVAPISGARAASRNHWQVPHPNGAEVLLIADAAYRDGTYAAVGQYGSGPSFLPVTVTLTGGVVTRVDVATPATNPVSLDYQRRFAAALPREVVGRRLDQIKIGRLAGSSLTPAGFNAALAKIKMQAKE